MWLWCPFLVTLNEIKGNMEHVCQNTSDNDASARATLQEFMSQLCKSFARVSEGFISLKMCNQEHRLLGQKESNPEV